MPLIKIDVRSGMDALDRRFREMVDEFLQGPFCFIGNRRGWVPPMDVCETETGVLVVAEVAGVVKESLRVVIEGEWLQVSGRRRNPFPGDTRRFFQVEIEYGPFERIVRLPLDVEPESASAVYEDGLLLIRLQKRLAPSRPIRIPVDEEQR